MKKLLREYTPPFHLGRCVDASAPVGVELGHRRWPHPEEYGPDVLFDEAEHRIAVGRPVAEQCHRLAQHGDLRAPEHAAAGLQCVPYAVGVERSGECG